MDKEVVRIGELAALTGLGPETNLEAELIVNPGGYEREPVHVTN